METDDRGPKSHQRHGEEHDRDGEKCGQLRSPEAHPDMQLFGAALLSSLLCGGQGSVGYGANGIAEGDPFLTTELQDFKAPVLAYRRDLQQHLLRD